MKHNGKAIVHPFKLDYIDELKYLEPAFRKYFFFESFKFIRYSLILGALTYSGFGILDYLVLNSAWKTTLTIRFGIICPVLLSITLIINTTLFKKHVGFFTSFIILITSFSFLAIIHFIPPPFKYHYPYGIIIVILWGATFFRIRFINTLSVTMLIIISFELLAVYLFRIPANYLISINFFLLTVTLLTLIVSYFIEFSIRVRFFLNIRLEEEQQKVLASNIQLEKRVLERTEALEKANLNLEREIAERKKAEVARDTFLQSEQKARKFAEILTDVTLALAAQRDLQKIDDDFLTQTSRIAPFQQADIFRLENGHLQLARSVRYYRENNLIEDIEINNHVEVILDQETDVLKNREPRILTQISRREKRNTGSGASVLLIPIYLQKTDIGVLKLMNNEPNQYAESHINQLKPIVNAAAIATENVRLLATSQNQNKHLLTIQALSRDIIAQYNLDELLNQIVEKALILMNGTSGGIYLYLPEHDELQWIVNVGEKLNPIGPRIKRGEGLSGMVWKTNRPMIISSYQSWGGKSLKWSHLAGAVIGVPIEWREEFLGVLIIHSKPGHRGEFTNDDAQILTQFASFSAVAIKNARLFNQANREISNRKKVEKNLRAQAAALEEMNTEMQELLFISSHHLQEPLRQIQTLSTRLNSKLLKVMNDNDKQYIIRIQYIAGRLQTLLKALIEYSRISVNAGSFISVDLKNLILQVVDYFKTEIDESGIKIDIGDLPTIQAEPHQIYILFQNLFDNAIKFRRPDQKLHIRITQIDMPSQSNPIEKESCQISFSDNGIGFDYKYADRIFRIFQKLHSDETYEGTGIGLSICKKIVQYHGGSIFAISHPGNGAAFIISLPLKQ